MMSNEVKPDLDRLVSVYIKIRDKKLELQAALKEQEEELALKMKAIEINIENGTASVTINVVANRRKKKYRTKSARVPPSNPDFSNSSSELTIPSAMLFN